MKKKHENHLIESHKEEHKEKYKEEHDEKHEDHLIENHDEKHEEKYKEKHEDHLISESCLNESISESQSWIVLDL